jgi:hypothetical protein
MVASKEKVKLKPIEVVQEEIKYEEQRHKQALAELDKELALVQRLPTSIADIDDCDYVDDRSYGDDIQCLYLRFVHTASARELKLAGVQGLVAKPSNNYLGGVHWYWDDGKAVVDGVTFQFYVGEAEKPAACEITEEEVIPTTPVKVVKVICHETGKVTTL